MGNITVGRLIEKARMEQSKISRKKLVRGLCSEQTLFAIEMSQSDADILMTDVLLQRLGKSPDKLEVILPLYAYQLVRRRDLIEAMILRGKYHVAKSMLEAYPKKTRLDKMFYHRMNACMLYHILKDYAGALKEIDNAIQLTLPEFTYNKIDEYLISTMEMENLLAKERILCELEDNRKNKNQMDHLETCLRYIDEHFTDDEEHAKICAKCSWLLARCYYFDGNIMGAMEICKKGIEGLRKNTMIYFIYPLLELMVKITDSLDIPQNENIWIKYYETMAYLWSEYAKPWYPKDMLFHNCYQKEYHLDYEMIRSERIAKNISQENLIEDIYQNPESLSRLENGKVSPNKNTYNKLMRKLGLDRERHNGFIVTDSYEIMELRLQLDKCVSKEDYVNAIKIYDEIKGNIDLNIVDNKNVVEAIELLINGELKKYTREEKVERWEKFIKKIFGNIDFTSLNHVPMRNESIWINIYCNELRRCNQQRKAQLLYRNSLNSMENSFIDKKYRYRSYSLLGGQYAGSIKNMKELASMIGFEIYCGKASMLTHEIIEIVNIINDDDNNQKDVIEWAKRIYYISGLYYFKNVNKLYKEFLISKKELFI